MRYLFTFLILQSIMYSFLAQTSHFDNHLQSTQAFIKNEGQFENRNWKSFESVEYAMAQNPFYIFFTSSGVTYRFDKIIRNPNRDKSDPKSPKRTNVSELIFATWLGSNEDVEIIASDVTSNYYSYAVRDFETGNISNLNKIKAYKKLVYKNLYDNIDVEYVFHPQSGVKYSVILHPGADPSVVKLQYSSAHTNVQNESISIALENDGKMHIKTSLGEILEHEPYSYVQGSNEEISSSYKYLNNVLTFELGDFDETETVIIDPWIDSPTYNTSTAVWEVETDASGNVYTIGGETPMQLKKYNSTGALQWTYTTPWDTASVWLGTLATDAGGTSYITSGTTPEIERVNNAGGMVWHNSSGGGFGQDTEYWTISFNCDRTKLIVGGTKFNGLTDVYAAIFDMDIMNGNVLSDVTFAYTDIFGSFAATPEEVRSISSARNAKFIYLTHEKVGAINQNLATCPTVEPTFQVDNTHHLGYKCENYLPETQNGGGLKALVANDNYFYTHSGSQIHQWDLNTGAQLNTVSLPGGASSTVPFVGGLVVECSGLSVDDCGNVYAGSTNQVVKYDENLNHLSSSPTSFAVYDVSVNANGEVLAVGAQSDNSATNRNGRIESLAMSACAQYTLFCCDASFCEQNGLCESDSPVTLTPATPGGTWSGTGVNTSSGVFDPAVAGIGTHTITYTLPCGDESHDIVVSSCSLLTACLESNGDVTVTSGSGPYTWYEYSAGGSTPITNSSECSACGYSWESFTGTCLDGAFPVSNCSTPAGWYNLGSGTTITPTTYPIYVIDAVGDSLVINASGDLTACSSTCTPPTLSETVVDVVCTGGNNGSIDLTITGSSTYDVSWSNSATTEDISGLLAGNYTVTVTDQADGTCTATGTYTVNNGSSPTVVANATATTICSGDPVTLTGSGTATSYSWDNGVVDGVAFNPTGTLNYIVIGTDGNSCTSTDNITVTVNSCACTPPAISESITDVTCAAGNDGAINITVTGPSTYTYSWSNSATTEDISGVIAGNYSVTVTDQTDPTCTASGSYTINDGAAPAVTGNSSVNNVCQGDMVTLTGGGANTYTWDNGVMDGVAFAAPATTTDYIVIGEDASGCTNTATVTLTVIACSAPNASFTPSQTTICAGDCIDFTNNSTNIPPGSLFGWNFSGATPANNTTDTDPTNVCYANPGTYWVTLAYSDLAFNLIDSTGMAITVNSCSCTPPTLSEIVLDVTCAGGSDGGIDVTVSGTSNYSYSWSNSASSEDISGLTSGNYTITVTDLTDPTCTATGTYTVNDGGSPTVIANATSTSICSGDAVTLTGSGTATSYSWNNSVTDGVAFNPSNTLTYTVTGTDANNCTASDDIQVTVNSCVGTTAMFSASSSSICEGDCISLTNTSINVPAGSLVGWNLPGATPSTSTQNSPSNVCYNTAGTYWITLVITDASFNILDSTGQAITVTNCDPPVSDFTVSAGPYCSGDCITFTNNSTYISPATFAWNFGNGQSNVLENPGAPICYNTPGTYSVSLTITDVNGSNTATQTIVIGDCSPPTAGFTVNDNSVCEGSCVNLTNTSINATNYQWTINGGTPSTSSSADPGMVCFFNEGSYTISLVVSNAYGSDSTGTSMTVYPVPSVETIQDTSILSSVEVELEAYTSDPNLDFVWSPETWLDCPDCQNTTATPQDTTYYIVTAINSFGCTDTAGVLISVEFVQAIGVPSAFSPNGDGVNDVLYVQGSGINNMVFRIYNRYGQKVFESFDQSYGWDGTFQGKLEDPGVFVYYVTYTSSSGEEEMIEGDVTLIK